MKRGAPGDFEIRDKDAAGRIARFYVRNGKVLETPALLPVVDIARQEPGIDTIREIGFNAVITNAYLLWKRMRRLAAEKKVHGVLGFDGIVMTDSGAYQILQYGSVDITPEEVIEYEKTIDSDIAVILDVPTGNTRSRRQAEHSVQETLRRARAALAKIDPENRVWTLPVQGGTHLDLLEYSARESTRLLGPYRLLALGSPTVLLERYDYAALIDMIATVRLNTPWTIPLHLFGAGHPMIIPFAVALGVDLFDSASYILYARDNRYITRTRTYRLEELEYFPCSCPVCSKYTPKELLEMPPQERTRLLATHNLYTLKKAIDETKQAIREGRLWELLEERSRAHPSLARAFRRLTRYSHYIEKHAPRLKGGSAKGIFIYGPESLHHPRILQHQKMLQARYRPPSQHAVLVPIDPAYKPFTRSPCYRQAAENEKGHIIGYIMHIGPVPHELAETYPLSQFEHSMDTSTETITETTNRVLRYIAAKGYTELTIYMPPPGDPLEPLAQSIAAKAAETLHRIQVKQCRKTTR